MSGGVCEVVRAETSELDRFVDRGGRFVAHLRAVFDGVAAARAGVVAQMGAATVPPPGAASPLGGPDPLAELIAEAVLANAFVAEVSLALSTSTTGGVGGLVSADLIDAALALAGLETLGSDRTGAVDQDMVEALAVRRRLQEIVAAGAGGPDHLQGAMIGLALEDYLGGLADAEAERVAAVLVDYGIDLQAHLDPDDDDTPGRRTAATMFVTQGVLSWPGGQGDLVDGLARRWVPTRGDGRERALSLFVDALDLEQSNDDLNTFGLGLGPWQRANQAFVRHAVLTDLIEATQASDGTISPAGQRLVDDVLDRYPEVVELSAGAWHDVDREDRYQQSVDGRPRVWPTGGLRAALAAALVAPNYGLDDAHYEAAIALDDLDRRLETGSPTAVTESLGFERDVLIALLADSDPDRMLLIGRALATGVTAAEAVRLATNASEAGRTDPRVRRLRLVYDTTPWGDPVPAEDVDPEVMPPGVARAVAAELGVLQAVQLARFAEGRPVPEMPLRDDQIELVARYDEVAPWFHHRFAWGWPGGAEAAVDHLRELGDDELERIFGDVPDGFGELLDELGRPQNQIIWDLLAGASGNDTFLGPGGTYRPANGRTVTSSDPEALLVQLALLREVGPYQELLDGDGSGVIHEDEVERWVEAARNDPSIPPALLDRVAIGAGHGIGEDSFGWDELAAIIGLVGLATAVVVTSIYSGGAAVPYWVQGGLVGLAALEGYAAYRSGDTVGAVLAGAGGLADIAAAGRLLLVARPDARTHARLLVLARRSELPAIRALAGQADDLTGAQFASRYRAILDDLGYDPFLDAIAARTLDEQLDIVRNIERHDLRFVRLGGADSVRGHPAARHGPHITDQAMIDRAVELQRPVSRWSDWDGLDAALTEARAAVADESWVLRNRGSDGSPINSAGWRKVDAGDLTVAQILADPGNRHLLKKEVWFVGDQRRVGTRFHPNGAQTTDDSFRVVLLLDSSGTYQVVTAFPTP